MGGVEDAVGRGKLRFIASLGFPFEPWSKRVLQVDCNGEAEGCMGSPPSPMPLRVITNAALDIALSLKPKPIAIKTQIDKVLFKTISTEGLEAAVKQYYELKKNQPHAYDFQERLLNTLGYNLMGQGNSRKLLESFS